MPTGKLCRALLACWLLSWGGAVGATDLYVSPTGSAAGAGSRAAPWDLYTALEDAAAQVPPGATVWFLPGVYPGSFLSRLQGTPTQPITVRPVPGARVTWDVSVPHPTNREATGPFLDGAHTIYRDFEITDTRTPAPLAPGAHPGRGPVPSGINIRLINCIIHHISHGVGIGSVNVQGGGEISGNLIYANGLYDGTASSGPGHGIYISNNGPEVAHLVDNILLDQAGYNLHIYFGDVTNPDNPAFTRHFHVEGNILAHAGKNCTPSVGCRANWGKPNLFAGGRPLEDSVVVNNFTYHPTDFTQTDFADCLIQARHRVVFRGNYCVTGARYAASLQNLGATLDVQGNTFVLGTKGYVVNYTGATGSQVWDHNTYYHRGSSPTRPFSREGEAVVESFADWQRHTGFDAHSTLVHGLPTVNVIVVRPNRYEPGRAHIAIYNWEERDTALVDVAEVLALGTPYAVMPATDIFGPPVVQATYEGEQLELPLHGQAFAVFVLRPTTPSASPVPPAPPEPPTPPEPPSHPNLLRDGGFETGLWAAGSYAGTRAVIGLDTEERWRGTQAAQVTGTDAYHGFLASERVSVQGGHPYTLSYGLKLHQITEGVTVHLFWYTADGAWLTWTEAVGGAWRGTAEWREERDTVVAPATAAAVTVEVRVRSTGGTAWVDDVALVQD